MAYVDGFVASVATARRAEFVEHAQSMAKLFKEFGAISVVDCWGDDVPPGKLTSFPLAVQCKPDETVVFGWVTWPSREVRDEAWKKVMADQRMQSAGVPPFDGKRMIFGGFEMVSAL
ncbi:DUF1428 domain-containing protein [Variovorax dokdonensis]|uniref:DUF1428 domain-containing protein n=1 Tax=Variovorax dokdonensis TaxID=344883 RepID=A0ABT7N556_9BURK|nr:DUF1428 domain-containing protein [Variovorax dokdonensis]MDM0043071.1 DUF1428 domain-containing protein [Variovorax dokdonensis]